MPKTPYKLRLRSGQTALDVLRALGSLTLLLVLLAGLPAVLYVAAVRFGPAGVDQLSSFSQMFTSPDTGSVFMLALVVVGWLGWASFAVSVLMEIPAQLRGRVPRHLPGLGWSQHMAAALIGSILIIGPTTGAALAAATPVTSAAHHVAATAPAQIHTASVADVTSTDPSAHHHTYTVQQTRPAQSLWSIAAARLGDGSRWEEIARLNQGRTMVDGQVFHASAPIQPGWVLIMPADADSGPEPPLDTTTEASAHTVTVHPGDTLSGIAEDELGSASDYPQLFAANQGRAEPDGAHLTDPDLIRPGWKLTIPDTGSAADPSEGHHQSTGRHEGHDHHGQDQQADPGTTGHSDHGADESTPAHPTAPNTTASPDPATTAPEPTSTARPQQSAPSSPATHAPAHHGQAGAPHAQEPNTDDADGRSTIYTAAAATSLAAAALLAVVGTRRALQQRRRRPRRRIPLPRPATPTADLEKHLRVASDPVGLDLADQALRTLAANCAASGRPLPPLAAVRVTARGLELHLSAPTPPIAPFTEQDDQPDLWWCPARGAALLSADEVRDITAPYPALVSVGTTAEQEPVLVNLESVGLLRLAGSAEDVRAVMLGLAVELASSGLADDATIMLAGLGGELVDAFPIRIEHHERIEEALQDLRAHDAAQRAALAAADLDGLEEARLAAEGGDAWVPKILISAPAPVGDDADALADLLSSRPRTAACVISAAHEDLDLTGAWTLPAAAGAPVSLPGLDVEVTLQRLDEYAYQPLLELLVTANRTDDVPAPAWTHPTSGEPVPNGPTRVTSSPAGDSALAQDTYSVPDAGQDGGGLPDEEPAGFPIPDGAAEAEVPQGVRLSVTVSDSSLATALPDISALAPAVTGPVPDDAPAPAAEEEDSGLSPDLFDAALQQVMAEHAGTASSGDGSESPYEDPDGSGPEELGATAGESVSGLAPAAVAVATPATVPAPRVTAVTSSVLAALHTPPDQPAGPQVRVLGSVDVIGTLGKVESNRRNTLTEISAWLILHPGKTRHELDEAIWPGQRVRADRRNNSISKLRSWFGRDPLLDAGDPASAYLPLVTDGLYSFGEQVTSDWSQFQQLYLEGMHSSGTDADTALATALALVRGRPFSDIDQSRYAWAEYDIQEMMSTIIDVAHELATRRRAVRDYRAAAAAASKGLVCDQQAELLYRDLFTIYTETGDQAGLERTAHQLTRIAVETGADSSPETVALVNALLDANRIASA